MDDILEGNFYTYCKTYLSPFGLWPLQNKKKKIILRVANLCGVLTIFIPQITKAFELRNHFTYFLICIPGIIFNSQFIAKYICMMSKDNKSKALLERIRYDFRTYKGESLKILYQYAKDAKKVNRVYVWYFFTALLLYNLSAFVPVVLDIIIPLNETRRRPVLRPVKYNIKKIENNFFAVSLHGFLLNMIGITMIIGFDTLLLNCAQHACALFQIVVVELKQGFERKKSLNSAGEITAGSLENQRNIMYQEVVKAVISHRHAIEFVDLVESTYAAANLLVIGITLVAITIAEYQTVQYKEQTEIMFRFAVFTVSELLHILFHNYPGQRIKDHSLMIYESCYNCEWHREDVSDQCKKLLMLMMLRSQRPSCLTGGGLYVLGLENYATILKASLSYFTFLSSV